MRTLPLSIRQTSQSLAFIFCIGCLVSWGQTFQGSFTGTVVDPSGAVVPGAVVTITDKDKGFSRTVTSSKDGTYEVPLLPPGRYALGAQKEGFRKFDRGPLTLLVNQHLREDIKLDLGQASDSIVVEAYPATVESQTSSVGTTIDEQKVNDVPLNGRNFLELALLVPGVSPGNLGQRREHPRRWWVHQRQRHARLHELLLAGRPG